MLKKDILHVTAFISIALFLGLGGCSGGSGGSSNTPVDLSITGTNQPMVLSNTAQNESSNPVDANIQVAKGQFKEGEIIVKFKGQLGDNASTVFSSGQSFAGITGSDNLDKLNIKYKIKKVTPLFKELHDRRKATGKTEDEIIEEVKAKFPERTKRAPKHPKLHGKLSATYVLNFDENSDIACACAEYAKDPNVEYAEPNYVMAVAGWQAPVIPNDPQWINLWGLQKTDCPNAWTISKGSSTIIVGIIDTGIDPNHEDLVGNIWFNTKEIAANGIDDDLNGFVDDTWGWDFTGNDNNPLDGHMHGTHVSGTIGGRSNNGIGVAGINWSVRLMALKGLSDAGSGFIDGLAKCVYYAANNGADVTSNSWGGSGVSQTLEDAFNYAYTLGVVSVAAAGNNNADVTNFTPANIASIIAVSAFDSNDQKASFSNWGSKIDVAAPGVGIVSTIPNNSYKFASGTSMACPHVSGLCALLLSHFPYTPDQIRYVLRVTADDIGDPGFDIYSGYGRINAYKAMQKDSGQVPPDPIWPLAVITEPTHEKIYGDQLKGDLVVKGSATTTGVNSQNFASYTLEFGVGLNPPTWTTLVNSITPVSQGILGQVPLASLVDGSDHTLRLTVITIENLRVSLSIIFKYDKRLLAVWKIGVGITTSGGIKVADLDRDGIAEIIHAPYSLTGYIGVYDYLGRMKPGWPVTIATRAHQATAPTIANIDQDNNLEIIAPRRSQLEAFKYNGSIVSGFPISVQGYFPKFYQACRPGGAAAVADINGDGKPEIIVPYDNYTEKTTDVNGNVHRVYDSMLLVLDPATGTPLPGWPKKFSVTVDYTSASGTWLWSGEWMTYRAPAVGDIDGDGKQEIVCVVDKYDPSGRTQTLYVWRHDGTSMPGFPYTGIGPFLTPILTYIREFEEMGSPSIGDVDGNGDLEIVLARKEGFWIWEHTGQFRGEKKVFNKIQNGENKMIGGVTFGHIEGQPSFAFGATGNLHPSFPEFALCTPFITSMFKYTWSANLIGFYWLDFYDFGIPVGLREDLFVDITGDGKNEIIANDGRITHALTLSGITVNETASFFSAFDGVMYTTPAFGDVTGNGINDLVVADINGNFAIWKTSGIGNGDWHCYGGNLENTRCFKDKNRPAVVSVDPTNGATSRARNSSVTIQFSEWMNPSSVNLSSFVVKKGASAIAGAISVFNNKTFLFTPVSLLDSSTVYTVTIKGGAGGATDIAGNFMETDFTSTFTTGTLAGAPVTPIASGPSTGFTNTPYTYSTSTTDPEGETIKYTFDWNNGTTTITDYVTSGTSISVSNTWPDAGTYEVKVRATDTSGNSSPLFAKLIVTISPAPPLTPTDFWGPTLGYPNTYFTYFVSTTDPDGDWIKYTFDWGDGTFTTTSYWKSGNLGRAAYAWSTAGTYQVRVMATDTTGNSSGWSAPLTVAIKNPLPPDTPVLNGPLSGNINTEYTWLATTTDPNGDNVQYTVDWGDGTKTVSAFVPSGFGYGAYISHSWSVAGTYQVKAMATDTTGLTSAWSNPRSISIVVPPKLTSITVTPGSVRLLINATHQFAAQGFDQYGNPFLTTFTWSATGGTIDQSGLYTAGASVGTFTVTATSGVVTGNASVDVIISNPPNIPSTPSGPTSGFTDVSYSYSTSTTDPDGDKVQYTFDWGDTTTTTTGFFVSGTTVTTTHIWTSAGIYAVKVKATDSFGISSSWSGALTVTIAIPNYPPTIPLLPSGPSSGFTNTSYSYSTSSTDANGHNIQYTFDWGDGTTTTTTFFASGVSASASHSWTNPGSYLVQVKATDSLGASSSFSDSLIVTISSNPPSTPNLSGPSSGFTGTSYTFSASSTDLDGNQIQYTFDWGDSTTTTTAFFASGVTASASHTWTVVGTYLVKVQAKDQHGATSNWSNSHTVTIKEAPQITSIAITPSIVDLLPSTTQQFSAKAYDQYGNPFPTTFTWSATGGTIDQSGLYTAGASVGTYTVTATSGAIVGKATVEVYSTTVMISGLFAHDTSKKGAGIQAYDRVVIFFSGRTNKYPITPSNIDSVLRVSGKSWGTILSATWYSSMTPPGYMGLTGNDGLVIQFAGIGTTVAVGDAISVKPGTIKNSSGYTPAPQAIGGTFAKWLRGDVNCDGVINLVDITYLNNYVFKSTTPPPHLINGDANSDGVISIADINYLVNYVLKGGPPPNQNNFTGETGQ